MYQKTNKGGIMRSSDVAKVVGITIAVLIVAWLIIAAFWGLGVATAGLYGRGEAHKQIQSADFRLAAYNHFFNLYASIKSLEGKIDELTAQLEQFEPGTRDYSYTLSALTGVKGLRHEAIQQYNADAAKDYTIGQFRAVGLPYYIPDTEYPPKEENR